MCFCFSSLSFVKQIARSASEVAKTLGTIDVSRLSMHAKVRGSQDAFARNCALSMAADLFYDDG
jgi:hypothetical protein